MRRRRGCCAVVDMKDKDYSDVNRWMVIDLPKHAFRQCGNGKLFRECAIFLNATYGEEWRCWLRKPTKEEMERTPWA